MAQGRSGTGSTPKRRARRAATEAFRAKPFFALPEPTHLRYLDATFALHNACGLALLTGSFPPGVSPPPRGLEDEILTIVRSRSTIRDELPAIEEELQ